MRATTTSPFRITQLPANLTMLDMMNSSLNNVSHRLKFRTGTSASPVSRHFRQSASTCHRSVCPLLNCGDNVSPNNMATNIAGMGCALIEPDCSPSVPLIFAKHRLPLLRVTL